MQIKPLCFIFGAGRTPDDPPVINEHDLIIAADGGYTYLLQVGIKPDVLIGDFDSLDPSAAPGVLSEAAPDTALVSDEMLILRLPVEKDHTDLMAALLYGLERGHTDFHIYGGTGGRPDHTQANIQCLIYLAGHSARGYLYDGDAVITAFLGEIRLTPATATPTGVVSVFAAGESAEGVYIKGLKYELENKRLTNDNPLGVSNAFMGKPAYIKAESGALLIVYPIGTQES